MRDDAFGRAITAARSDDLLWFEEHFDQCELYDLSHEIAVFAARYGSTDVLRYILFESVYSLDIEANNNQLLNVAAENGYLSAIETLLEADTSQVLETESIVDSIIVAAKNGHFSCFQKLLDEFEVTQELTARMSEILSEILRTDHSSIVKILADVSQLQQIQLNIFKLVSISAQFGSITTLNTIIEYFPIEISFSDEELQQIFNIAAENCQYRFLHAVYDGILHKHFNRSKAELQQLNWTELLNLAAKAGAVRLSQWILETFKDDLKLSEGFALRHAARNGHFEIVQLLLRELTTDELSVVNFGEVVYFAVIYNNIEVAKCLFENTSYRLDHESLVRSINELGVLTKGTTTFNYVHEHLEKIRRVV